jgi:hypothetical protein
MRQDVIKIIEKAFNLEIAQNIFSAYKEIRDNYILKKWKPSELDGGHFVESVRRAIEKELFGTYTPFDQKLTNFDDNVLKKYETISGNESFRILIPRALKSIYNIRNKRGVGHVSSVSPNEMDATYILYTTKWVLSEIIRTKSSLSISETQKIVDEIIERQIELIWESSKSVKRILNPKIAVREQVLIFLFNNSPLAKDELRKSIEYKNTSNFIKILKGLHAERLIEFDGNICEITPKGISKAESIILFSKVLL